MLTQIEAGMYLAACAAGQARHDHVDWLAEGCCR